jgi:nitric oxide reductase NorD protein
MPATVQTACCASKTALRTLHYPEWDRLIGRLRPHWCTVIETVAPAAGASALRIHLEHRLARTVRLLRGAAVSDRRPTQGRSEHGDLLHTGALIDAGIALRSRRDPGRRLHRDSAARVEPVEVLLLVDTSASTALELEPGRRVLDALRDTAWLAAAALEGAGHRSAIQGFASDTRHRVRVQRVKDFAERAFDGAVLARAGGLTSGGSTRMGAAIRHAAEPDAVGAARHRTLTDGEPHDVDIHDPRYLTTTWRMRSPKRAGPASPRCACTSPRMTRPAR